MIYGERHKESAFFLGHDGLRRLSRVPFMSGDFSEDWLQHLLERNPSIIPSGDISESFAPLLCIGKNVAVGADGHLNTIDNLYLTPSGHVVLVSVALFRNQVPRRAVVSSLIDCADDLQHWDFNQLETIAEEYFLRREGRPAKIIDVMCRNGYLTYSDESSFVDAVNTHLSKADFLLLVIGDGIRTAVFQLADFLNEVSAMPFVLALAETEIYRLSDDGMVLIPNLLLHTDMIVQEDCCDRETEKAARLSHRSRREFIESFAEQGGYDPDLVTEFLADMELVDGILVSLTPHELIVSCVLGEANRVPLLHFRVSPSHGANIWIVPDELRDALIASDRFPFEINDFLEFFSHYIESRKGKRGIYEAGTDHAYYANVGMVLESSLQFVDALEALMRTLA